MFDPQKYDTRMRDPDGKRKRRAETGPHDDPTRAGRTRTRASLRTAWRVALVVWILLALWRFASGSFGQGFLLLILGALALWLHALHPRTREARGRARRPYRGVVSPVSGMFDFIRDHTAASFGMLFLVVSLIGAFGNLYGSLHPFEGWDEQARRKDRPRPARSPAPLSSHGEPRAVDWRTRLPPQAPHRVSGAVFLGTQQTVPHVHVRMTTMDGRVRSQSTDDHGVFTFDDVETDGALFEVRGAVDLGVHAAPATKIVTGSRANRLTVSPSHAILLFKDRPHPRTGRDPAVVHVAATNGALSGQGTWPSDRKAALVTGLEIAGFYDLLVQDRGAKRAALVERIASGQTVVVSLEPSTTVHGRIDLPPGTALDEVEVVLMHGRLRVPARVSTHGWQADHLPRDTWWDVSARRKGHGGAQEAARAGVHAGSSAPILLDLR